jgi:hypothetical protein
MNDLEITPVEPVKKVNRHVVIAQNHLRIQRDALTVKIVNMTAERDGIDAAIDALDK